jgi:uncharacterized protein Yka (UPF0111/DUF47 family)
MRAFFRRGPDVLAMLREQAESLDESIDAFARWAAGDASAGPDVHQGADDCGRIHRALVDALIDVLSTPVDREDLYLLSERLQDVAGSAREVVREADALGFPPDDHAHVLADLVNTGVDGLVAAVDALHRDRGRALHAVEMTFRATDQLGEAYSDAMGSIWRDGDPRLALARHAVYRRCADLGEAVDRVAHRVRFGVLKDV